MIADILINLSFMLVNDKQIFRRIRVVPFQKAYISYEYVRIYLFDFLLEKISQIFHMSML